MLSISVASLELTINHNQYGLVDYLCCPNLNLRSNLDRAIRDWSTNLTHLSVLKQPVSFGKEQAIAELKAFIAEGGFRSGDRLPSERDLMNNLGMTRTMLRRALDTLEREGAIWRHVGKGTFLANLSASGETDAFTDIGRQLGPVRMMRARLCIEPAIAREAAINASDEAVTKIRVARDRSREASNWADYETQDALFHRTIAEAADNILLLTVFDQLNQVGRAVASGSVARSSARPSAEHTSFKEHDAIARAIETRDPNAAQDAMRAHIGSVSARLFGEA